MQKKIKDLPPALTLKILFWWPYPWIWPSKKKYKCQRTGWFELLTQNFCFFHSDFFSQIPETHPQFFEFLKKNCPTMVWISLESSTYICYPNGFKWRILNTLVKLCTYHKKLCDASPFLSQGLTNMLKNEKKWKSRIQLFQATGTMLAIIIRS